MIRKLYGLDLFSGYGGITLALEEWVHPITYCEKERYAQSILLSRMGEGRLPDAPIWDDVCTLQGSMLPIQPGIIYGGFPCQDLSVAGNGEGLAGKRSGLFFEIMRLSEEIKPRFIFLENVPGIRTRGLSTVVRELANIGYDCRWCSLSAEEVGANHKRQRWFLLAYSKCYILWEQPGWEQWENGKKETFTGEYGQDRELANPDSQGQCRVSPSTEKENYERFWKVYGRSKASPFKRDWWEIEPPVGRVVNGSPFRMDRIKALGNGVVPLQVKKAFKYLMGIE